MCSSGFRIVLPASAQYTRRCESCACAEGNYQYDGNGGAPLCTTGREVQQPICLPCSATCNLGQYAQGVCLGTETFNNMSCSSCTFSAMAALYVSGAADVAVCPVANRKAVAQGTVVMSASEFRRDCRDVQGLDCLRRQRAVYPFDGMDILEVRDICNNA